jgi:hypothetical protein
MDIHIKTVNLCMVYIPVFPAHARLKQDDQDFEANFVYKVRPCLRWGEVEGEREMEQDGRLETFSI